MFSLTLKLFLAGLLISALPLSIYQYIVHRQSAATLTETYAKDLQHKTALTALLINQAIAHKVSDLKITARTIEIWQQYGDFESILNHFEILHDARFDLTSITLVDLNGTVLRSTDTTLHTLRDLSADLEPLLQRSLSERSDDVIVSEASLRDGETVIYLLQTQTKSGITTIFEMNFLNIELLLSNLEEDIEGDRHVYLVDPEGVVVFTHDTAYPLLSRFETLERLNPKSLIGEKIYRFEDASSQRLIAAYDTISKFGVNEALEWRVVSFVPVSVIEKNLSETLTPLRLSGLGIIIVTLMILLLLARSVTKPILHIVTTAKRLREGDLSARVHLKSSTAEIEVLGSTLNDLAATVETHTSKLEEQNALIRNSQELLQVQNRELEALSITDKLTQLSNRAHLDTVLQELTHQTRNSRHFLSVMMLDIDYFKQVNDTFGHPSGDLVLKQIARLLLDQFRSTDTIGRWGGEEFMVILPNTTLTQAAELAEKLRLHIEQTLFLKDEHLTTSIGVAMFKQSDTTLSLVDRVDQALYRAKKLGRNRVEIGN